MESQDLIGSLEACFFAEANQLTIPVQEAKSKLNQLRNRVARLAQRQQERILLDSKLEKASKKEEF
jgi:hypothetical protein